MTIHLLGWKLPLRVPPLLAVLVLVVVMVVVVVVRRPFPILLLYPFRVIAKPVLKHIL